MAKGKYPRMGGNMGGGMNNMLKQAQKMQQDMARVQEELEEKSIEVASGGGAVTVKVTGKKELQEKKIDPQVIDPDDVEMLEDLVLAAVNEALRKADEMASNEMAKITGGMNIPGLI